MRGNLLYVTYAWFKRAVRHDQQMFRLDPSRPLDRADFALIRRCGQPAACTHTDSAARPDRERETLRLDPSCAAAPEVVSPAFGTSRSFPAAVNMPA